MPSSSLDCPYQSIPCFKPCWSEVWHAFRVLVFMQVTEFFSTPAAVHFQNVVIKLLFHVWLCWLSGQCASLDSNTRSGHGFESCLGLCFSHYITFLHKITVILLKRSINRYSVIIWQWQRLWEQNWMVGSRLFATKVMGCLDGNFRTIILKTKNYNSIRLEQPQKLKKTCISDKHLDTTTSFPSFNL